MSETTIEQLKAELNKAHATIEAQAETLSKVRIAKEHSEYFRNKDSADAKVYKHLSETAKHIEAKHRHVLDAMKKANDNKLLTVAQFNSNVAQALREVYNI